MKAIIQTDLSNPRILEWTDAPEPTLEDEQVLVRIRVAGVNRADLLQATGHYPSPKGVVDTPGLECAGVIGEVKDDSQGRKVGDKVCCLLPSGACAEKATVPTDQILPLSHGYSFTETTSIVEVTCTVFSNVVMIADLKEGDLLLVRGGTGGISVFAIQMAERLGARVVITAGSAEKLAKCRELGADIPVSCREEDSAEVVAAEDGANVILDIIGAEYFDRNVKTLTRDGHLVTIGVQGGVKGELNISRLLNERGSITAIGLRYRDLADKVRIANATENTIWPILADGTVAPQIHEIMGMHDAARAHELLDNGAVSGKTVLTV